MKSTRDDKCTCGGFADWLEDVVLFWGGMLAQLAVAAVLTLVVLITLAWLLQLVRD